LGSRKTAIICGDSMLPTLKNGDIVFFKKYKQGESLLEIGQIVIFSHPLTKKRLIKRINFVNTNSIGVLGDNIEFSEDSNNFGLVNKEKIIGLVTAKLSNLKLKNILIQKESRTFLNPK